MIYSVSNYLPNNRILTYEYLAYNIWSIKFKCAIISLVLQFSGGKRVYEISIKHSFNPKWLTKKQSEELFVRNL